MDTTIVNSNPNPRAKASCISVLLFWWTIGLFKKGYNKVLGAEDLYDPLPSDGSNVLGDRLEKQWRAEFQNAKKDKSQPNLLKTIFRTFLFEFLFLACFHILNELILRLGTPLLLGALLQYFKPEPATTYENALIYAAGICIGVALSAISINHYLFYGFHLGGKIRIAVCSVVYRKALRLSKTALGETAPGKIVNLVANDVNRFDLLCILIHHMWSAPLSALVVGYFMYTQVGYAGLIGTITVFVAVPIQSYTGKLSSKFRLQTALKTDERVRLMDEIVSGVQVIKMYAWEKPFCALVNLARRLELKVVRKSSYIRGYYMTSNLFTMRMALFGTLVAMMLMGEELTTDKVFVFSSYFAVLAQTMGSLFARSFAEIAECLVAVRRLQNFLIFEEFQTGNVTNGPRTARSGTVSASRNSHKNLWQNIPYIDDSVVKADKKTNSTELSSERWRKIIDDDTPVVNNDNYSNDRNECEELWSVKLDDVTAKWSLRSSETTLKDINLEAEQGKLYIVIGLVGAGKSSLLSTILGELNLLQGKVMVNGGISYASQEAWVFGSSVRQNILFGQEFDRHRYQRVVKACDLLKDFKQFPQGDQTVVGERGSSLSGGQKARINLARAVYRQADIYLLDDPLSAVDAHVRKHLFSECLQKYLKGKTRILATHQLQYLKEADSIILMEQGRMYHYSDYHELLNAHPQYSCMIEEEKEDVSDDFSTEIPHIKRRISSTSTKSRLSDSSGWDSDIEEIENPAKLEDLMEATSRKTVKGNLLLHYFQSGSSMFTIIVLIFLFLLTQFVTSLSDYFIPILVKAEESRSYYKDLHERETQGNGSEIFANKSSMILDEDKILPMEYYIYIYAVIVLSVFVIGIIRSFTLYTICVRCSQRLHDLAFGALIRTSMRFFDTNPIGRILNRFSKDLGAIDELLPKALLDAGQILLVMLGSLVVTCTVNPMFLVPVLVIGAIFYWIRIIYLRTSKNVKRLEGITRSPVFTHLNATLNGISTIRAYRAQKILKKEFDKFQDVHTSSWYMFISCSMAFGFSLDICCSVFTTLITFSFLILKDSFSGGQVGLAITQVTALTGMIQWGMRQAAEVTNQIMSVERVLEYADLPPEKNLRDSGSPTKQKRKRDKSEKKMPLELLVEPPENWPSFGYINFRNVYMRYSDEEAPVLNGLTLTIRPSEKVGVVGRTGAGKSSLISALFRLAKVEGVIEIDGIDTGKIALEDLRRHISIIPQDPVLFSGTLRRNLDPFNEFPDKLLWEVLEEVELKDAVVATGHGLDNRVLDRGSNYSVGQRQLVCLARAILRNNRVLMLDEATANVDPHTDALIQHTIRTKFAQCTVLTVAHRLNTIMDSDKVLVMDRGCLEEYDHPHILLQNEHGSFTSLVKETGPVMYEQLCRVARDAYITKRGESPNFQEEPPTEPLKIAA